MRSPLARAAALVAGLATAGCTLAPHYTRPAAPVPAAFPSGPVAVDQAAPADGAPAAPPAAPAPAAAPPADDLGWRDVFGDPRLQALVALALQQNRDLRIAALNAALTRAQYGIQRANQYPQLSASGIFAEQRTPADLSLSGQAATTQSWSVGLGLASFELDFFGRVRSLSDAALQQYLASEEARRSAQLSLVAAVATQYLSGLAAEAQVALARQTLEAVQGSLKLTRRQAEAGRVSELDLRTAEAQVATARFNLAVAEQLNARAASAMVLLLGGPVPADLPPGLALDAPRLVAELQAGVPSEVLARRPDVLAAEHALQSANATIGAARAAFFPSISLTAFGGRSSATLDGLFTGGADSWAFSPRINLPIFQGGALMASLDVAKVRTSIEVARYERTLQGAFREVADALEARGWHDEQLQAQLARVAAESRRYELSEKRYRGGVDSYLTLLTAQRDLYAAQLILIQERLANLANLVDLYKALGGGWRERTAAGAGGQAGPATGG